MKATRLGPWAWVWSTKCFMEGSNIKSCAFTLRLSEASGRASCFREMCYAGKPTYRISPFCRCCGTGVSSELCCVGRRQHCPHLVGHVCMFLNMVHSVPINCGSVSWATRHTERSGISFHKFIAVWYGRKEWTAATGAGQVRRLIGFTASIAFLHRNLISLSLLIRRVALRSHS